MLLSHHFAGPGRHHNLSSIVCVCLTLTICNLRDSCHIDRWRDNTSWDQELVRPHECMTSTLPPDNILKCLDDAIVQFYFINVASAVRTFAQIFCLLLNELFDLPRETVTAHFVATGLKLHKLILFDVGLKADRTLGPRSRRGLSHFTSFNFQNLLSFRFLFLFNNLFKFRHLRGDFLPLGLRLRNFLK